MTGPHPDPGVARRIRSILATLVDAPPTLKRIQSWRPRQRQHVERWAARQLLVKVGASDKPLPRPAVLR